MKRMVLVIYVMVGIGCMAYSQNTNYGTGTVSTGLNNSSFGYYAGNDNEASSNGNSFFGSYSGRYNTTGDQNSYFGYGSGRGTTTGTSNTAIGESALYYNQVGSQNVAVGSRALYNNNANQNTAVGNSALTYNTGNANAALGFSALFSNTSGASNTAVGASALWWNTTGSENTALGREALIRNETGFYNTALGFQALYFNTSSWNTATGNRSLYKNTTGSSNTAHGYGALYENTAGHYNVALGRSAMYSNTTGAYNTAAGYYSFSDNTTGSRNSATGFRALDNNTTGGYNTAHGAHSLSYVSTGSYNTGLGYDAGPTLVDLVNTTAIGYQAVPTASNQVRVGNTAVTSIGGQVSWTTFSDGRFKKDVKEDVSGMNFINQLRPVSYVVDKSAVNKFLNVSDSSSAESEARSIPIRQTGFVAQEVESVVKKIGYVFYGIDAPKSENDHYGIRYAEFVVPLVKAFQELSTRVDEQHNQIQLLLAELNSKNQSDKKGMYRHTDATLIQNTPNPFNSETEIKMTLPENVSDASIMIYSLEGKQMKNIHVSNRGDVSVKITAGELSAGMYLYALIADGRVVGTKRMILTE
jgi:trimeric autotransporter adhesin